MNTPCPKCGEIPATCSALTQYFRADQEPYQNGKKESLRSGEDEISTEVYLWGNYCEKCDAFIDLGVSEAPMIDGEKSVYDEKTVAHRRA